ncbi:MAG: glycoside hydrolase family 27 protein, partial [Planctomycetota bacterium]
MTPLHRLLPTLGIAVVALAALPRDAPADTPMTEAMPTKPPRGWNSFDAYDSRIDEAQFRACVEVIEERLLPHGWDHVVVDYLWFDPDPKGWDLPGYRHGNPHLPLDDEGRPLRRLAMDEHGLLLPPPERWPSAAGGQGFKPLADWVHAKGMKFGLHIMRGVPRQAYYDNTPILGSDASARDIAETDDTCLWCNYMYGIDPEADGAQAYYDAMMRLYASWGVDYVKADDLLYPVYAAGEIEMIQRAIQRSGRPMTLSLSPGAAPLGRARHVAAHSNLWRVSPDFWDRWTDLRRAFDLLDAWSPHRSPGRWP